MTTSIKCPNCGNTSDKAGIERIVFEEYDLSSGNTQEHLDYGEIKGYFCLSCGENFAEGLIGML